MAFCVVKAPCVSPVFSWTFSFYVKRVEHAKSEPSRTLVAQPLTKASVLLFFDTTKSQIQSSCNDISLCGQSATSQPKTC